MISGMLCLLIICLIFVIDVCLSFTLHNMSSTFQWILQMNFYVSIEFELYSGLLNLFIKFILYTS